MKLIQLNIWQGRIIRHVTRFLEEEKPDIVCLQEVCSAPDPVPSWDCFSSLEALQKALPDMHWFFAPLYSFEARGRKVTAGNAIGSRSPIRHQQIGFTHGHYTEDGDGIPNTRNFQMCQLELGNGKFLSVINHHAYWDKHPAGTADSVRCMQIVKDAALRMPQPLLLCGDMNVWPQSETMQIFKDSFTNLTETHGIKTTLPQIGAALDRDNMVACDHVLVSSGVTVQAFQVSEQIVSDHKPLVLTFGID